MVDTPRVTALLQRIVLEIARTRLDDVEAYVREVARRLA